MPLNAAVGDMSILLVDVPAGEDMGRGKGGGCLHSMEEEDLKAWRDEYHTGRSDGQL